MFPVATITYIYGPSLSPPNDLRYSSLLNLFCFILSTVLTAVSFLGASELNIYSARHYNADFEIIKKNLNKLFLIASINLSNIYNLILFPIKPNFKAISFISIQIISK